MDLIEEFPELVHLLFPSVVERADNVVLPLKRPLTTLNDADNIMNKPARDKQPPNLGISPRSLLETSNTYIPYDAVLATSCSLLVSVVVTMLLWMAWKTNTMKKSNKRLSWVQDNNGFIPEPQQICSDEEKTTTSDSSPPPALSPLQTTKVKKGDRKAHEIFKHLLVQHKHIVQRIPQNQDNSKSSSNNNSKEPSCSIALLKALQFLVELHPSVLETFDSNRLYPLHLACLYSAPASVVSFLVDHDPAQSIQKTASTGNGFEILPLHFACWRNNTVPVVRLLIQAYPHALTLHTQRGGWLPLHLACRSGPQCRLDLVQELVQQYPAALQQGGTGSELPLHCACYYRNSHQVICYLAGQHASALAAKTRDGWTPLLLAATRDLSLDTLYFLARQGPHVLLLRRNDQDKETTHSENNVVNQHTFLYSQANIQQEGELARVVEL